mmetsp:Transcript_13471/g.20493  ORF Transcript_13471/g.20493 Transcript_13471/m.20493 type:complete len:431 (-) Transcript_13471:1514-2806(-)|eukprot:CAMPEP_0196827024 /NCGR_PEP_ID=MMETSP1362-20130617/93937_1 /TAXON_ID=163516 /ORGANISM="Leptocylindrus danicus, Strain CCMP1856" /LENGTH=430 /DNA_ID=CAMNT_0042207637 /DNA_START=65 /DNA_END=1357 /DNA_ORIENTATION=+
MQTNQPQMIDASKGEGGGQVIRNCAAYACLLTKSIHLTNIRQANKRQRPGLRSQHVTCLKVLQQMCGAKLRGAEVGEASVVIEPENLKHKPCSSKKAKLHSGEVRHFVGDSGTAGSITLLIQATLPCALFFEQKCKLILKGGTNATMAPQYDYFERVFLPIVSRMFDSDHGGDDSPRGDEKVSHVHSKVISRGYYPKGGGVVHVEVEPIHTLKPISLVDRGSVTQISIRSWHAGNCHYSVALKMHKAAKTAILEKYPNAILKEEVITENTGCGSASGIMLIASTSTGCLFSGSSVGSRTVDCETTGISAANELLECLTSGGCVDDWLQDQLILYMALADGVSEMKTGSLTLHTKSAILYATELCGARFDVVPLNYRQCEINLDCEDESKSGTICSSQSGTHLYGKERKVDESFLIRCHGIGLTNDQWIQS